MDNIHYTNSIWGWDPGLVNNIRWQANICVMPRGGILLVAPREWYMSAALLAAGVAAHGQGFYTGGDWWHCSCCCTVPSTVPQTACAAADVQWTCCPQCCTPLLDIASGARKIRDNGDMCCLAGLTFVTFCHTQKTSDNALVVSFFFGNEPF